MCEAKKEKYERAACNITFGTKEEMEERKQKMHATQSEHGQPFLMPPT